jgi:hypothetical protein
VVCAVRSGISRIGSKSAFYGAAAKLTALGVRRRRQTSATPPVAGNGNPLPTLSNPELISPLPANESANRLCGQCGAFSEAKPGHWYRLNNAYFCQDCAPTAARKNGAVLTAATQSAESGLDLAAMPTYWSRWSVDLKEAKVQSGSVRNLSGYQILRNGRPSGLSLIPELKSEDGQVRTTERWSVNYDLANKPVAGPFADKKTAQHAAELLCNFDWTRDIDDFNPTEVASIKAIMINFRQQSD